MGEEGSSTTGIVAARMKYKQQQLLQKPRAEWCESVSGAGVEFKMFQIFDPGSLGSVTGTLGISTCQKHPRRGRSIINCTRNAPRMPIVIV